MAKLVNPYKPGAGIFPPHLAGRESEIERCNLLFNQSLVIKNILLTGLRGVGKTVLLSRLKEIATGSGWMWCGTDMSESASVSENTVATRLITDISVMTSTLMLPPKESLIGFGTPVQKDSRIGFKELTSIYETTPGLASDKLKHLLSMIWLMVKTYSQYKGIILAYDEVQTMKDHADKEQYPLSLILEVFQSLQIKEVPILLILTGLPTLQGLLVSTRTYTERMFETIFLNRLDEKASRDAIEKPIKKQKSELGFSPESIDLIIKTSSGYPYFIQFICREVFDSFIQQVEAGNTKPNVPIEEIIKKLDIDFFSARWATLSDRQRDLLGVVASLENSTCEFTTKDVIALSKTMLEKPLSGSHITQMFEVLQGKGIIYKNRHGRYSFAVPLLNEFIKRSQNV